MRFRLGLAALLAVIAGPAAAGPTFEFSRLGDQIPIGQRYITGCAAGGLPPWSAETSRQLNARAPSFKILFRQELQHANIGGGSEGRDLFAASGDHTDYQVGALVTSLTRELCGVAVNGIPIGKASLTMGVEWQVYSLAQGRVVARVQTQGTSRSSLSEPETVGDKLANQSFVANVQQLLASPEFQALANGAPAASPETPREDLRLALASQSRPMALKDAMTGVVTIFAGDWLGSGVLISSDGYLLTNYHVAGGEGLVRVRWPDGQETAGQVVRGDSRRDVALVKTTPPRTANPVPIRRSAAELGETVYAMGTPREREFAGTLTRGIVSATARTLEGQRYIQSDVAITHGNSGGPLVDEKGAIIGLAQSVYEPDGVGQNINFFVPIEEALKALSIQPAS